MNILITGHRGYIGSVLTEKLKHEFTVKGIDAGYFDDCYLDKNFKIDSKINNITKDIRNLELDDFKNVDCVIHLAALSNDPLGELSPGVTKEINYNAAVNLAKLSKEALVKKFVFISSQSMYGISTEDIELDEENSKKNPVTEYAKTKWKAEQEIKLLSNNKFCVVSLRPSTIFGASPNFRSDIVLNNMLSCAFTTGKIEVKSDGSPWRPVLHILDLVSAIEASIKAPNELINQKSYNIGVLNGNYQIKNIAEAVKNKTSCNLKYTNEHLVDPRSYKVSFKKILQELKDYYKPKYNIYNGLDDILRYFKQINLTEEDFRGFKTNRMECIKKKIIEGKLDSKLKFTK